LLALLSIGVVQVPAHSQDFGPGALLQEMIVLRDADGSLTAPTAEKAVQGTGGTSRASAGPKGVAGRQPGDAARTPTPDEVHATGASPATGSERRRELNGT
jgi:hypothetical protein